MCTETKVVYAKRLNSKQRALLLNYYSVTGLEPMYQDDLDEGLMNFAELWNKNVSHIYDIYCHVSNMQNGIRGLGL